MTQTKIKLLLVFLSTLFLLMPFQTIASAQSTNQKQFVYDYAHLLSNQQKEQLEILSKKLSEERNTAFLIITLNGTDNKGFVRYLQDFYDEQAPGYDKEHGNTAILLIDLEERDVFLTGFKKAEEYLDQDRLAKIRKSITPELSAGNYYEAFTSYLNLANEYMGYEPGVNPDNLLFKWWFQLIASISIAAIIVAIMAFRSGGRVTVSEKNYLNSAQSGVVDQRDQYVRTTVSKVKKPSNNSGGGGGGGGTTRGGHSYSGSSGKF